MIPYNPIAGGMLSGKHDRSKPPEEGTRFTLGNAARTYQDRYWHDNVFDTVDELVKIADERGHPAADARGRVDVADTPRSRRRSSARAGPSSSTRPAPRSTPSSSPTCSRPSTSSPPPTAAATRQGDACRQLLSDPITSCYGSEPGNPYCAEGRARPTASSLAEHERPPRPSCSMSPEHASRRSRHCGRILAAAGQRRRGSGPRDRSSPMRQHSAAGSPRFSSSPNTSPTAVGPTISRSHRFRDDDTVRQGRIDREIAQCQRECPTHLAARLRSAFHIVEPRRDRRHRSSTCSFRIHAPRAVFGELAHASVIGIRR